MQEFRSSSPTTTAVCSLRRRCAARCSYGPFLQQRPYTGPRTRLFSSHLNLEFVQSLAKLHVSSLPTCHPTLDSEHFNFITHAVGDSLCEANGSHVQLCVVKGRKRNCEESLPRAEWPGPENIFRLSARRVVEIEPFTVLWWCAPRILKTPQYYAITPSLHLKQPRSRRASEEEEARGKGNESKGAVGNRPGGICCLVTLPGEEKDVP